MSDQFLCPKRLKMAIGPSDVMLVLIKTVKHLFNRDMRLFEMLVSSSGSFGFCQTFD